MSLARVRPWICSAVCASALATGALSAYRTAPQTSNPSDPTRDRPGQTNLSGIREAAWSPDGKRLAASWFDAVWTMSPEGRDPKRVVAISSGWVSERDPAWSPDGKTIAFSADTAGQFDLWLVPAGGGLARRLTSLAGDERWPSWTHDGRVVFSHRDPGPRGPREDGESASAAGAGLGSRVNDETSARARAAMNRNWQLYSVTAEGTTAPVKLTSDPQAEWQARVSPDGKLVAFVSDRDSGTDATDLWVRELPSNGAGAGTPRAVRVTSVAGVESHPAWAPDNSRLAYFATRTGQGNAVWVSSIPPFPDANAAGRGARGGGGRFGGAGAPGGADNPATAPAFVASRHAGVPAWSPDGETLAIATFSTSDPAYNGNPNRNDDDPPIGFAPGTSYVLWRVDAPRAVDANAKSFTPSPPEAIRWTATFDRVWQTLKSLYYQTGESAATWDALKGRYRPHAAAAKDAAAAEDAVDAMIAEQPPINPALESSRAVVSSGSPLASRAGALVLEQGGNVVDAGIAVAFALGVVEPDATSIGGDGQAILFLKGMSEPIVIEYKDMTPSRALPDNTRLFNPNGSRTAVDGPTVANIPGVVAGLDLLYRKYGSKHVAWADLIAPAIKLADEGFTLDEALPTTIAEGRASFVKYPESAKIFMPGGKMPQAGDRFVNKDYAETLRTLATEGGQSFYRGSIASRIAADMADNGGVITAEDLAQYKAVERKPLAGRYHGHLVYSAPPPVSTGAQLIETLNILDNYQAKPGASVRTDAEYLHYLIEAWRVRDGGGRMGDPERTVVDLGNHLEPAHALDRFKLIDPKTVYVTQGGRGAGGGPDGTKAPAAAFGGGAPNALTIDDDESAHVQTGTTAFVVADAEGNMIAFTQTLSTWGGNYYVSKNLGFLYNDHFRGGGRGVQPLVRSSSTSVPTLVFAPIPVGAGQFGIPGYAPRIAVGCAGNAWIPASVYNIITNVIDSGMTAQQAIEAPRLLIGNDGSTGRSRVQIEDRIPRTMLADLEARGHTFTKVGRKGEVKYGYASVAVVNTAKGTVGAGADPRRSHGTAAPGK